MLISPKVARLCRRAQLARKVINWKTERQSTNFVEHLKHFFCEEMNILLSRIVMAQTLKKSACNVGHLGSIPRWGISTGEGNGKPHQYSSLENSINRGVWWATVHGVAKSQTQLSD